MGGDVAWDYPILPDAATTFLQDGNQADEEGDEDDYLLDTIALYVGKLRLSFFFDRAAPHNQDRVEEQGNVIHRNANQPEPQGYLTVDLSRTGQTGADGEEAKDEWQYSSNRELCYDESYTVQHHIDRDELPYVYHSDLNTLLLH